MLEWWREVSVAYLVAKSLGRDGRIGLAKAHFVLLRHCVDGRLEGRHFVVDAHDQEGCK